MVQTLTLISPNSFPFSVQKFGTHFPAAAVGSNRGVSYTGKSNRRAATVCAVAVAEGTTQVLERRRRSVSLYDVLKVKQNASAKEIKAAYRNLAKLYHPDASAAADSYPPEEISSRPDPTRSFIEIHDAYVTLSDPSARALYDLKLSVGSRRRNYGFRVNGSGFYPTRRWETDQCW